MTSVQARAEQYSGAVAGAMRESMREAGLHEGAYLSVEPATIAEIGRLSEATGVAPSEWFPPLRPLG